jgi:hypothetical protein
MSERIKRYDMACDWSGESHSHEDAKGDWCRSTDVAAIEADRDVLTFELAQVKQFHKEECDENDECRKLLAAWDKSDSHYVYPVPELIDKALDEITRLRRIVEAARPILDRIRNAGTIRESGAGGQTIDQNIARQERRGVFSVPENMFREWEEACASDAAKQPPAKGERANDTPEPIGNCPKCGAAVYTREGFCGLCQ